MRRHGKSAGADEAVDFYHGGDWFHELHDGFAVRDMTALSPQLLRDLQAIVAGRHADAALSLGGEMGSPIDGLAIIVTSAGIWVAWYEQSAAACLATIRRVGVQVLDEKSGQAG